MKVIFVREVPDKMHKELKKHCKKSGFSMSYLVKQLIEKFLKKGSKK